MREGWGDTPVSLSTELRTGIPPLPQGGQGHSPSSPVVSETDRAPRPRPHMGATSKQGHPSSAGSASSRFTLKCTWLQPISF